MRYVALDIGSSFVKCALVDTEHLRVADVSSVPALSPRTDLHGRYELDADAFFAQAKALIDEALLLAPDANGILISAQMHGCAIVDAQHRPLTGLITWQDTMGLEKIGASGSYVDLLAEHLADYEDHEDYVHVGRKLAVGNLFARVSQGLALPAGSCFCTTGGYVTYLLTGAHACHASQAASTGCATARADRWFVPAIAAAQLSSLWFPRIIAGFEPVGTYRFRGREYPIFPDVGDHQASALGSLAREEEDAQVNIGTGGMVGRIVTGFSRGNGFETRPLVDGLSIHTITGLPGGRHLQIVLSFLQETVKDLSGILLEEATLWRWASSLKAVPDAVQVRPDFFVGEGVIASIGPKNLRPDALMVGAYRAVAVACAKALGLLGRAEQLVYSGGAVRKNAALRTAIEAECGLPGARFGAGGAMEGLLRLALYAQGVPLAVSCERMREAAM